MSAILVRFTEEGGDLTLDADRRIIVGHPLVTELWLSLHTDRAPEPGDPAPEGVERLGNWQRSFDPDAIRGSRVWMARYVRPLERALVLVPIWAAEATEWMITTKRALSIEHTARRLSAEAIELASAVQVDARTRRKFLSEIPYA